MLRAFSVTDIGRKRQLNQDYVYASCEAVGRMPNLFIVADGMGGHNAGDFASRLAVETIVSEIGHLQDEEPATVMKAAIEEANSRVRMEAAQNLALKGMGTTVVAAVLDGDVLSVANVGDSRLYVVNEQIRQITQDHSLVEEMVRLGGIGPTEAKRHPDRNIITRAVGASVFVEADFFQVKLTAGDIVLMCSDGLTNMLEDEEIRRILKEEGELRTKALQLVRAANDNGGKDNIAVVLIEPFGN